MPQSRYILIKSTNVLILFFSLSFFPIYSAYSETVKLADIVSRIQKKYEAVRELEANSNQETFNKTVDRKFKFRGKLYIKKPDKLRMEIKEPEEQLIVTNGSVLWIYIPENNQAVKEKMDGKNKSKLAITILAGMAKLDKEFKISKEGESGKSYMVGLVPKDPSSMIKKMELEIEKNNYNIRKVIVDDSFGNWTSYELTDVKINKGIPDSKFDFKVPESVEVVESMGN
ncbi:MAG: outer membrane lipoprotein carrier protein LolA [Candidatus Schekmanbacteria bacterium RBG_16_38_11]|uniref:Outer-membrane lipoprotein carrier protein n=1 Tax=Candidatus Schekmanbacteria bacterium RBG_16_38_11 TaxID=1817880 RepID=A0A1F7S0B3_9BACT|nr:MAG: outer membrane lipoprotein carrier protein LolA [Candidatus Schekmanbacteria bacterium RBG_16_38_11]